MQCAKCGSDNKPDRRFCRSCGHRLELVCADCGAANDPTDRFCGSCGVALVETPLEDVRPDADEPGEAQQERRFVTVLFADLAGFTSYAEAQDPETVRSVLTDYFDRTRDVVERFGGVIEKYIGDAVMAVWGATIANEDDAERAVRAGLELADAVARLGDELSIPRLAVRVGVLSGEAAVAPATPERGFVVGDLVNTAARLQSLAEPGTVVVGETTYRMLQGAVGFEQLGKHEVKGKAEPITAWRAVRVMTDRTQRGKSGGLEPVFVGREAELRLLKDALHATERTGRARLVSIIGEAGIGKTRLAWELRKYVGGVARDIYWHEGRSPAYDQGLTFWALGEMVRQRAHITDGDDAMRSRTKLRTAVAEYVTAPTDQEWIELRLAALLGLEGGPTGDQSEFFAAVRTFFQAIARRGTTVLVFEDFNWADGGLMEFVEELVERSPRNPILVVTLARPDLLDRAPGWGAGRRNFTSSHLGPLPDAEMTALVRGMVQGIGDDACRAIVERANGIPLYAVELVRMLIADGDLVLDDNECCTPVRDLSAIRVPDTVRAVIGARLDRLPTASRALLQDAAVLGTSFTVASVAAMSDRSPARVEELLEALVHRELLEVESDVRSPERGQYRFVQSMIREVAYDRLTRDERRVRHRRAAAFYTEQGDADLVGAVANHYMAAYEATNDPDEAEMLAADATAALSDAADRAARLHSHAQSLALLEYALAFAKDPQTKAQLWQRGARSAGALALHETAIGYAYQALDWFTEHGDPAETAAAAAAVGDALCHAYRAPEAIEVLKPIVDADPALGEPAVVTAAAGLARAYLMALRDEEAAEVSSRVMEPAERFGLVPTIVDGLVTRGTALGNLGRMHEAIALLQGATRYAQDNDLPLTELRAANNLGHLLAFDDHAAALEVCRGGMEQANRIGDVRLAGSFTWAVSAYLERDGRYEEARTLRDDARSRMHMPEGTVQWYDVTDLLSAVERGDTTAAASAHEAARLTLDEANPQSEAGVVGVQATLDLISGKNEEAYAHVMAVAAHHRLPGHLAIAMHAAAVMRDDERLEAVAEALRRCRHRGRMVDALRWATEGALAAVYGDTENAVARFSQALGFRWLRMDRARLQALFATVVGTDVAEARIAAEQAFTVFSAAGASAYMNVFAGVMPGAADRTAAGA